MNELKPCPFCGSTDVGQDFRTNRDSTAVQCYVCGCGATHEASWETRADSTDKLLLDRLVNAVQFIQAPMKWAITNQVPVVRDHSDLPINIDVSFVTAHDMAQELLEAIATAIEQTNE